MILPPYTKQIRRICFVLYDHDPKNQTLHIQIIICDDTLRHEDMIDRNLNQMICFSAKLHKASLKYTPIPRTREMSFKPKNYCSEFNA